MPRVGTPNLNLGGWLQGENPGDGSQTVDNNGLNGNWLKIDRALGTQHNPDGSHKANVIVGANLVQTGAGAVADGTTLEFSSNAIRIKDGAVTGAKLAAAIVDNTTLQIVANVMSVKAVSDTQITGVNGSKLAANSVPTSALEYKEYLALVLQSGTGNPVMTIIKNTLGAAPNWTRVAAGIYNSDYVVDTNKLFGFCLNIFGGFSTVDSTAMGPGGYLRLSSYNTSGTATDTILTGLAMLYVRIYP